MVAAPTSSTLSRVAPTTFGNIVAGFNNDCPPADPPRDLISLTLEGEQADTGLPFTLCVERPDTLNSALALGIAVQHSSLDLRHHRHGERLHVPLRQRRPTDRHGHRHWRLRQPRRSGGLRALVLDGTVSLERTWGATVDNVTATLSGRVAVAAAD